MVHHIGFGALGRSIIAGALNLLRDVQSLDHFAKEIILFIEGF
jgi:hypothetical protein